MKKETHFVRDVMAPLFIVVDLFCGAGGTSTGFANTNGLVKVIAAINHDKKAIKSHWLNHKKVKHFEEDIRTLDLTELIALVKKYRKKYPKAKLILWASLECTNFSKAKGGKPRDADSRTLADHLLRYIKALAPEIIQIENVVEFMAWGPLDENGKPVSKKNGCEWIRWRKEICELGYFDEWKELNSANFGAYTSRNRLFGMFAIDKSLIHWPEPTHFKNPSSGNMFEAGYKWKPVREVLDLEDEGNTIFERKKSLCEKTLERIYAGLIKYVANGDTAFIAKYYSGRPEGKVISIDGPAGTIKTSDGQSIIQTCFLTKYHSSGGQLNSIDAPGPTLPCKDSVAKIQTIWLDRDFGKGGNSSIENPSGSLLGVPKVNLIHATKPKFILNQNSSTAPAGNLDNPSPVITQRTHYLVNPQWGLQNASIDKPCFTLIARMDKAPPYIITTQSGDLAIAVYEKDSAATLKIKEFMAAYGIIDIKMRMLKIPELLRIQGFPKEYQLFGTQTDQKKFIGNSVHPLVPEKWIYAISENVKQVA